jgi:hypothetical protein|tara:strand:- start:100 stop:234 length:135 start_codon:yes stop_codon:yes gene_type:complete
MHPLRKIKISIVLASVILLSIIETLKKKFIKPHNNSAKNEKRGQ